jgi:hypothetical protein
MQDGLTKYQRYNKKHPVIGFRGDPELVDILDAIAGKEGLSRQKLLYTIVKAFLKDNYAVKIKYEYEV